MPRLKKKQPHLTDADIEHAADGQESRRVSKHLDRCVHCNSRVRHIDNVRVRQKAQVAQQQKYQREAAVIQMFRRPPAPTPPTNKIGGPRLLSDAEWAGLRQAVFTPEICIPLITALVFLLIHTLLPNMGYNATLLVCLVVGAIAAGIYALIIYYQQDDDEDEDDDDLDESDESWI